MKFDYKKSLGQNFLKDKNIIKKIADSINPTEEDLIIEIGPGAGALTKELVKKKSEVICFEIDTRLKEILEQINSEKLTIIFKDFLSIKINEYIDQNITSILNLIQNILLKILKLKFHNTLKRN